MSVEKIIKEQSALIQTDDLPFSPRAYFANFDGNYFRRSYSGDIWHAMLILQPAFRYAERFAISLSVESHVYDSPQWAKYYLTHKIERLRKQAVKAYKETAVSHAAFKYSNLWC